MSREGVGRETAGLGRRASGVGRSDRLRALNTPRPATVELGVDGAPASVELRIADCGLRSGEGRPSVKIEAVRETWRIDDEWWRAPIVRHYYEVVVEGGGRMILFEDLVTNEWFWQSP